MMELISVFCSDVGDLTLDDDDDVVDSGCNAKASRPLSNTDVHTLKPTDQKYIYNPAFLSSTIPNDM